MAIDVGTHNDRQVLDIEEHRARTDREFSVVACTPVAG